MNLTADPELLGAFDVAVVGAGLAGSVAARRAQELGCRTVLIERAREPATSGNTRLSGGTMHAAELHMRDTPADEIAKRIFAITDGRAQADVVEAFTANCARAVSWIEHHGAIFEPPERSEPGRLVFAPARSFHSVHLWRDAGPHQTLQRLHDGFRENGGTVQAGTTVHELVIAPETGGPGGLLVRNSEGVRRIDAGAVILADGGFQANQTMLQRYVGRSADRIFLRGAPSGTGDAIRLGEPLRARLINMQYFYGHLLHRDAPVNDALWPMPMLDELLAEGVVIDGTGARILDESTGGIAVANFLARLDDPLSAWILFDAATWEHLEPLDDPQGRRLTTRDLESRGGSIKRAPTIRELAVEMGLDPARLDATVSSYNEAVRADRAAQSVPPRTRAVRPIDSPPFAAVPIVPGITFTMGGLLIDGSARVLDLDNMPIPGLFAAGGSAGGVQGGPRGGYVGGLSTALVFGLLAAEAAHREGGSDTANSLSETPGARSGVTA
jgi:fumarate reductase flavoprotein subunit